MWELNGSEGQQQDVASFLRDELKCSVCLSPYKLPTTLPCGHTFCRYCVGGTTRCPLCRHRVAANMALSVNMVLHNLLKNASGMNSCASNPGLTSLLESSSSDSEDMDLQNCERLRRLRRCGRGGRRTFARSLSPPPARDLTDQPSPAPTTHSLAAFPLNHFWHTNIGKPFVPLNAFARLLVFQTLGNAPPVMANDLISCLTQIARAEQLFDPVEGMLSERGAGLLIQAMDSPQSAESLQAWVERTVESNMHFILQSGPLTSRGHLSVIGDKLLKVTEATHDLARLPACVGRTAANDLVVQHSSVSSYHLLIRETTPAERDKLPGAPALVLHDIGSSVGTMVKLESHTPLRDGWVLHLGDKVEFKIGLSQTPRSDYLWHAEERRVVARKAGGGEGLRKIIPSLTLTLVSQTPQTLWSIPSTGAVLGRGREKAEGERKAKIAIACPSESYISAEHCLLSFGGAPPAWRVIDLSAFGTFRRLQPFADLVPLDRPLVLKIGQCRAMLAAAGPAGK